ncbi:MAG: L-alanine-DL-glutamate epimerase-like enolase superfamily enzyme [Cryomorphaceae bacterium]|jgi:L-alanine-DL-glutamate epimerase-like enolase superfamily enzyme
MKIVEVQYEVRKLTLIESYKIAYETVGSCENVFLKIITDTGLIGHGCAAPDMEITHETAQDVVHSIERDLKPLLLGELPFQRARFNHILKMETASGSSCRCMMDIALCDLYSRKAQLPLYQFLGGFRHKIATSITIGILPLHETLDKAKGYLEQGFKVLKLKGGLNMEEDVEKVSKLREQCGRTFDLRFDANQGYTIAQSIEFIEKTRNASIEIFEQPTPTHDSEAMAEVTQSVHVPVMADESLRSLKDAFHITQNELANMVNIKIQKVGGILESAHINSLAKGAGMEVMVGCLDESSLGIAAGLHFALSRPNIEFADLDGHLDLQDDPVKGLFKIEDGFMIPSQEHGLGNVTY